MVLNVHNLEAWYDGLQVLFGIKLEIDKDELVALLGKKGAGKTTFFKSIFNLVDKKQGDILYWDEEVSHLPSSELTKRGLSYVLQAKNIFLEMSIYDNIMLGAYASKEQTKESLTLIYEIFPELKNKKRKKAAVLNSKECLMLAIARALIIKPKLLLLDEPSAGLLPKQQKDMFERIQKINKRGIAILLAEQNVKSAIKIAERIYILENGRNRASGKTKDMINNKYLKNLM